MVIPGSVNVNDEVNFMKLNDLQDGNSVTTYLTQFRDKVITGSISGAKALVEDTSECDCMIAGDSTIPSLHFTMMDSGTSGTTKQFVAGEEITALAVDNTTAANFRLTANQVGDLKVTIKSFGDTGNVGTGELLISEILTKVNNAKDKPKKIAVLQEYDSPSLRMVLKGAFDPKIKWALACGTPPYMANEAPVGTEHTLLRNEAQRLWHFVEGADANTTKTQKETMYIQILEGLSKEEAQVLLDMKDKKLNKVYKGLSESVVKEAFGWDNNFVKPEQK